MNMLPMPVRAEEPTWPAEALPLVVFPQHKTGAGSELSAALRACVERHLPRTGSLLFRGFACDYARETRDLRQLAESFPVSVSLAPAGALLAFTQPRRAWLTHAGAPGSVSSLELADSREFYWNLPHTLRGRLLRDGLHYARIFHEDRLPWQDAFQTRGRTAIELFARAHGYSVSWLQGGALRLERAGAVVGYHAPTDALFFEDTIPLLMHARGVASARAELSPEFELRYGDGSAVEDSVIADLLDTFTACATEVELEAGDVLVFDSEVTSLQLAGTAPELHIGL